jgi:acyl carrier protein
MSEATVGRLAAIWKSVLSVPVVRDEDDFYKAGGDSMGVINLVARVCEELDLAFEYRSFLAHPTFERLVRAVLAADHPDEPGRGGASPEVPPGLLALPAHQRAVDRSRHAASELLGYRPFGVDPQPKQTLALALLLSMQVPWAPAVPGRPEEA